jgi:hypothetical protein
MSRILTDSTGLYDLAAVTSVHKAPFVARKDGPTEYRAILNFSGGQVQHTESDFTAVATQWKAVKLAEAHPAGIMPIVARPSSTGGVIDPVSLDPMIPIPGDGM